MVHRLDMPVGRQYLVPLVCCRRRCVTGGNLGRESIIGKLVWLSSYLSIDASFQQDRVTTARACTRTVIPVSPQGKTGIPQTLARARKDEIPARRFAWPE